MIPSAMSRAKRALDSSIYIYIYISVIALHSLMCMRGDLKSVYIWKYTYGSSYFVRMKRTMNFTRLRLVASLLGCLHVLPPFPMPPLTYCKMAGPKYVGSQSRSKTSRIKPKNLNTYTNKITHALIHKSHIHSQRGGERRRSRRPSLLRIHIWFV